MGIPEKRRAVTAMVVRWNRDLERLHKLFGEYGPEHYDEGAEMQRNLEAPQRRPTASLLRKSFAMMARKRSSAMADLTYKPPVTPTRKFRPGDTVEVLDREHTVLSRQRVVMASGRICKTECGRIWGQDGWCIGDDDRKWPFPSIRLAH